MKPWKSIDGRVRIYHGDCRELLPTLNSNWACITDPPYGIDFKGSNASTLTWGGIEGDATEPDLAHILNRTSLVVAFGANNYPGQLPHRGRWICWDKRMSKEADKMLGSAFELAWTNRTSGFDRTYRVLHGGVICDGKVGKEAKRLHPTQKPIKLMVDIIKDFTQPNDVVLDPYLGSGTTAIACLITGRRCVGIEIDPAHYNTATNRVANWLKTKASGFGI